MKLFEIWYDTKAPSYTDHTARIAAETKEAAIQKLRDYHWQKSRRTIYIYHTHVVEST